MDLRGLEGILGSIYVHGYCIVLVEYLSWRTNIVPVMVHSSRLQHSVSRSSVVIGHAQNSHVEVIVVAL